MFFGSTGRRAVCGYASFGRSEGRNNMVRMPVNGTTRWISTSSVASSSRPRHRGRGCCRPVPSGSSAVLRRHCTDHLHQFRHHCHLTLVGVRQDDGLELGIDRLQRDLRVPPGQAPEGSLHDALHGRTEGGSRLQAPISTPNMAVPGRQTG